MELPWVCTIVWVLMLVPHMTAQGARMYYTRLNPLVSCVEKHEDMCVVHFGYENGEKRTLDVTTGQKNRLESITMPRIGDGNGNMGQITRFFAIHDKDAFTVKLKCKDAQRLRWTLMNNHVDVSDSMDIECPIGCDGKIFGSNSVDECGVCGGVSFFTPPESDSYNLEFFTRYIDRDSTLGSSSKELSNVELKMALSTDRLMPVSSAYPDKMEYVDRVFASESMVISTTIPMAKNAHGRYSFKGAPNWFKMHPSDFQRAEDVHKSVHHAMEGRFQLYAPHGVELSVSHIGELIVFLNGALLYRNRGGQSVVTTTFSLDFELSKPEFSGTGPNAFIEMFYISPENLPDDVFFISSTYPLHNCVCMDKCGVCNGDGTTCVGVAQGYKATKNAKTFSNNKGDKDGKDKDKDKDKNDWDSIPDYLGTDVDVECSKCSYCRSMHVCSENNSDTDDFECVEDKSGNSKAPEGLRSFTEVYNINHPHKRHDGDGGKGDEGKNKDNNKNDNDKDEGKDKNKDDNGKGNDGKNATGWNHWKDDKDDNSGNHVKTGSPPPRKGKGRDVRPVSCNDVKPSSLEKVCGNGTSLEYIVKTAGPLSSPSPSQSTPWLFGLPSSQSKPGLKFVVYPNHARLVGRIYGTGSAAGWDWELDMWLKPVKDNASPLPRVGCKGSVADTKLWTYYTTDTGYMHGSGKNNNGDKLQYKSSGYFQVGASANGRNTKYGMWFGFEWRLLKHLCTVWGAWSTGAELSSNIDFECMKVVEPVLKCVDEKFGYSNCTAIWGYKNYNGFNVHIEKGSQSNRIWPPPRSRGQPEDFQTGTIIEAFREDFKCAENLTWVIVTDTARSSTADLTSPRCQKNCTTECKSTNPCLASRCNPNLGKCETVPLSGVVCNDGKECTTGDVCRNGTCSGTPKQCTSNDKCQIPECHEETGECVYSPKNCDDGDFCTVDSCDKFSGNCVHEANTCDDKNPCTKDSCNSINKTCVHTPIPHCLCIGKDCSDNNECTEDTCDDTTGKCLHEPVVCSTDNKCSIGKCDVHVGCTYTPKDCSDGDQCTLDVCDTNNGKCKYQEIPGCRDKCKNVNCDDHNPCTIDKCDPDDGKCQYFNKTCSDSNKCTIDTCVPSVPGGCVFTMKNCTDNNMCTIDSCDHETGDCVHTLNVIDDGNLCTNDTCDPATGITVHTPKVCTSDKFCSVSICESSTGKCVNSPRGCDDYNPCTIDHCNEDEDKCEHWDVECKEYGFCQVGKCFKSTGKCEYASRDCSDNITCTLDSCSDSMNKCLHTPLVCTSQDKCKIGYCNARNGTCAFEAKNCTDDDPCTVDKCDAVTGECVNDRLTCDDHNPCTTDLCDKNNGKCVHVNRTCTQEGKCSVGFCDVVTGSCKYTPKVCSSNDNCTVGNCDGNTGQCVFVNVCGECDPPCDDHNECTVDVCNPFNNTCVHVFNYTNPNCSVFDCPHVVNVSVTHTDYFDIISHEDFLYEFVYNITDVPGSVTVLAFDPFSICGMRNRGTCDNYDADGGSDYCDLFDHDRSLSNGWKKLVIGDGVISFRRNFTLEDLSGCRGFSGDSPLVFYNYANGTISYNGTLYVSQVRPENCHRPELCEEMAFQSAFEFHIDVNASGIASVVFSKSRLDFFARWVKTVWLSNGDVLVAIETCVRHVDQPHPGQNTTILVNPRVLSYLETGRPMLFVENSSICNANSPHDRCCQEWHLQTHDGSGSGDLSGIKPLEFDVSVNGIVKVPVGVNLDLGLHHSPHKIWKGGNIDSTLRLFFDRNFQHPYSAWSNASFIDCETVYGLLESENIGTKFSLVIGKVKLCIPTTGEAAPFNPHSPGITGCNTPGVGMIKEVLFDRDTGFSSNAFKYTELSDPPTGAFSRGFSFEAKIRSVFMNAVEVEWKIEHVVSKRSEGLEQVEFYSEQTNVVESARGYGHSDFSVSCGGDDDFDNQWGGCKHKYWLRVRNNSNGFGIILFIIFLVSIMFCLIVSCCDRPLLGVCGTPYPPVVPCQPVPVCESNPCAVPSVPLAPFNPHAKCLSVVPVTPVYTACGPQVRRYPLPLSSQPTLPCSQDPLPQTLTPSAIPSLLYVPSRHRLQTFKETDQVQMTVVDNTGKPVKTE